MNSSLWREHILPFIALFSLLALATLAGDYLLHYLKLVWIGRYIGIAGTILIVVSLSYSLRKRKMITSGDPRRYLRMHEICAWLGSVLVLIHAGIHFNTILPWLATVAMLINVMSGLVGKILLEQSRKHVLGQQEHFRKRGLSQHEVEQVLFWDSVALGTMTKWRLVHIPIFVAFAALSLGHIVSIFLFWGWK
jgi:hypothetical protein